MLASKIICNNTYSNKSWCIIGPYPPTVLPQPAPWHLPRSTSSNISRFISPLRRGLPAITYLFQPLCLPQIICNDTYSNKSWCIIGPYLLTVLPQPAPAPLHVATCIRDICHALPSPTSQGPFPHCEGVFRPSLIYFSLYVCLKCYDTTGSSDDKARWGAWAILGDDTKSCGLSVVWFHEKCSAMQGDPFGCLITRLRVWSLGKKKRIEVRGEDGSDCSTMNQEHSEDIPLRRASLYPTSKSRRHRIVAGLES